jgi:hypothetical protein
VPLIDFNNSPRLENLIRADILYLSLHDAIALAIENNLDVEFERLELPIAKTDILRAKGGGFLRGISLLTGEAPLGIGGPAAPVLNAVSPTGAPPVPTFTPNLTTFVPAITPESLANSAVVTNLGVLPAIASVRKAQFRHGPCRSAAARAASRTEKIWSSSARPRASNIADHP